MLAVFKTLCVDLADVRDQLNRWLTKSTDEDEDGYWLQQKLRQDDAIGRFARNLLKRTLSESFVGVELTDGNRRLAEGFAGHVDADDYRLEESPPPLRENEAKVKMAARSLSLELVKRNQQQASKQPAGGEPQPPGPTIVTGNWGCGSRLLGDAQLKLLIQWAAASVAGASRIVYYTCNHRHLSKVGSEYAAPSVGRIFLRPMYYF